MKIRLVGNQRWTRRHLRSPTARATNESQRKSLEGLLYRETRLYPLPLPDLYRKVTYTPKSRAHTTLDLSSGSSSSSSRRVQVTVVNRFELLLVACLVLCVGVDVLLRSRRESDNVVKTELLWLWKAHLLLACAKLSPLFAD